MGGGHENVNKNEEEQQDDVEHISEGWQAFEEQYKKTVGTGLKKGMKSLYEQDPHLYYNLVNNQMAYDEANEEKGQPADTSLDSPKELYPSHGFTKKDMVVSRTDKKGNTLSKPLPKNAEVAIAPSTEAGKFEISTVIKGEIYSELVDFKNVAPTPNSVEQLPRKEKDKIHVDTLSKVQLKSPSSESYKKKSHPFYVHHSDTPIALQPFVDNALEELSTRMLTKPFETSTIHLDFTKMPKAVQKKLPKEQQKKYLGQPVVFRITRLDDKGDNKLFLVETLGQLNAPLAITDINDPRLHFNQFGFTFKTATPAEVAQAEALKKEMKTKGEIKLNDKTLKAYEKAYLNFSEEEKKAIIRAVEKIPASTLQNIKGIEFQKRVGITDLDKRIIESVGGFYDVDEHTISLGENVAEANNLLYGDKDTDHFTTRGEDTVIHEVGHAVDMAEQRKAQQTYNKAKKEASEADNRRIFAEQDYEQDPHNEAIKQDFMEAHKASQQADQVFEKKRTAYSQVKTYSGGRFAYDKKFDRWHEEQGESDFTKASDKDRPRISLYATQNPSEDFAESFTMYIMQPETLKVMSPNVYGYFKYNFPKY
ncbi:MAG: hypothetical protein ACFB0B_06560 [Thermonemataceae bacterium]